MLIGLCAVLCQPEPTLLLGQQLSVWLTMKGGLLSVRSTLEMWTTKGPCFPFCLEDPSLVIPMKWHQASGGEESPHPRCGVQPNGSL